MAHLSSGCAPPPADWPMSCAPKAMEAATGLLLSLFLQPVTGNIDAMLSFQLV